MSAYTCNCEGEKVFQNNVKVTSPALKESRAKKKKVSKLVGHLIIHFLVSHLREMHGKWPGLLFLALKKYIYILYMCT